MVDDCYKGGEKKSFVRVPLLKIAYTCKPRCFQVISVYRQFPTVEGSQESIVLDPVTDRQMDGWTNAAGRPLSLLNAANTPGEARGRVVLLIIN